MSRRVPTSIETAVAVHGRVQGNIGRPGGPQYFLHADGFRWSTRDIRTPIPREPAGRDLQRPS